MSEQTQLAQRSLAKSAGGRAICQAYIKKNGSIGHTIRCGICKADGTRWGTDKISQRERQRSTLAAQADTRQGALALWVFHMQNCHADHPQPVYKLPDGLDRDELARLHDTLMPSAPSAEELLLREIFGDGVDQHGRPHRTYGA